jgi:serine/threonine protein kinase
MAAFGSWVGGRWESPTRLLTRICALPLPKVINSAYLDNDTARQRFLRAARAAAGLQHPNVAAVFNLGTEQDKFYYVMEFIDGETVDARIGGMLRYCEV